MAFCLLPFLRLSNCTIHDGQDHTPHEICSGRTPDYRLLRTFGCHVYIRPPGKRPSKLASHVNKGIFLGYAKTWKNIMWHDPATNMIIIATHAQFDEGMNDLPSLPPNAAYLKRGQHGSMPPKVDKITFLDLDVVQRWKRVVLYIISRSFTCTDQLYVFRFSRVVTHRFNGTHPTHNKPVTFLTIPKLKVSHDPYNIQVLTSHTAMTFN